MCVWWGGGLASTATHETSPHCSTSRSSFSAAHLARGDIRAFHKIELAKDLLTRCDLYAAEMDLEEASNFQSPEDYLLPNHQNLLEYLGHKKYQKIRSQLLR